MLAQRTSVCAKYKGLKNGKIRKVFINIKVCSEGSEKSQKFSKKSMVNMRIDGEGGDWSKQNSKVENFKFQGLPWLSSG